MKCILCHERDAVVPDRESGTNRKKVCRRCHAERLIGDLKVVLDLHNKREKHSGTHQTPSNVDAFIE